MGHIVITHLHPWFVVIIPTSVWRSKTRTGRVMGDRERQPEKENGGNEWRREGQRDGCPCVCVCVRRVCPTDCHLPLFGGYRSVGGGRCWEVGGVRRRVDKGDSTLKPTKLQKQWILNPRLNSWVYVKHYCIIILDLSPTGCRFDLEQQGTSKQSLLLW